jgi:hypothetical protein
MVAERVTAPWLSLAVGIAAVFVAVAAEAQTRPLPPASPKRWEFGGGVRWTAAVPFDTSDANERDPTGAPFRLFSVSTRLEDAFGAQVYIAPPLTRALRLELSGSYAAPRLTASLTQDVEQGADTLIDETITQLAMDVAVLYEFRHDRLSRPLAPFLIGGAGFSRELHDGQTLVETGQSYFGGMGVKGYFMRGHARRSIGLRFDARALFRTNGVTLDGKTHIGALLTASVFKQF